VRRGNLAASCGSSPGRDTRPRGIAAPRCTLVGDGGWAAAAATSLHRAVRVRSGRAVAVAGEVADLQPARQPLRVGVVEDRIGKTVGRVTVQDGDGLDGANEAMLQARHYICNSEGSRAAAVEAERGGVVPRERAEIQVRSDRATGAGELVKFGELVWYRFSFKIAGDWRQDVPAAGRQPCRTVIHRLRDQPRLTKPFRQHELKSK
jgi:hypothetical protein